MTVGSHTESARSARNSRLKPSAASRIAITRPGYGPLVPRFFVHGLLDSARGMERTAQGAIRTTFSAVLPKKIFSNSPLLP